MLLIGDIHLTAKIKTDLLDQLKSFVANHPEEKNLIFLGDFVYHFSYDRASLLGLFELFLEWYAQGKSLYILAGNHDWLGNSFVFEEGKRAFDVLKEYQSEGKLHFITEPRLTEIEGEKILFFPFMLEVQEKNYPFFSKGQTPLTEALLSSKDKHEQLSGKVNQLLNAYLQEEKNLTIIHHYYLNKEKFPGYRASFSFKDVALSEHLLDIPNIKLISGHLHAPFLFKNYLCTGSVWATSPLEVNQIKGCFTYHQGQFSFFGHQLINYFALERDHLLTKKDIEKQYTDYCLALKKQFAEASSFSLLSFETPPIDLSKTILYLRVEQLDYEKIDELMDPELRKSLLDFRLKKASLKVGALLEQLEKPDHDKLQTFGGWKELLKTFLQKQYPDDYENYEQLLKELKVL